MNVPILSLLRDTEFTNSILEVSLKSCVPVFMAYPELVTPPSKNLEEINKYYVSSVDYFAPGRCNVGISENDLLNMFNALLSNVLSNGLFSDNSKSELPKLSLNIDIGSSSTDYGVVIPKPEDLLKTGNKKYYDGLGVRFNRAMREKKDMTENQHHNIMLLQILRKKYNEKSAWR